jgi:predicted kinase
LTSSAWLLLGRREPDGRFARSSLLERPSHGTVPGGVAVAAALPSWSVGVRNYLIEGVSGAGKTTVAEELERRGYQVVHGDRVLARHGDPTTGNVFDSPPAGWSLDQRHEHWIWDVQLVQAAVADDSRSRTFFCGGSRNSAAFLDLFDAVFVLEVDVETLNRRLDARPADEFGNAADERALVLRVHQTREDLPMGGVSIDAARPIADVVDAILRWVEGEADAAEPVT